MYTILLIAIHILIFFSFDAVASTSIEGTMCNAYNIATGPAGKVLGSIAIVSLGVGFFTGRISWTFMVAVSVGVASMTAAPQIVSVLTGKSVAQCIDGTYITTCEDGECYSCPVGYGGHDCKSCDVGFAGINCSSCDVGYRGNSCSECDTGYGKYQGVCHKDCNISEVGITDSSVKGGLGVVSCNAANFTGS
ncbi:MAG: TrbC/VirB2 family protein, partial [Pelagibacterales bacterium]|nr:TrbC/VirB2 family protein [Pelagibacterales bacterium]